MTEQNAPYFDFHIFCCTNRREVGNERGCCASKGSTELRDYMKFRVKQLGIAKARVNNAGCLDRCEHGPTVVIYPEGTWYSCKTKADIDEVIDSHLINKKKATRLLLPPS